MNKHGWLINDCLTCIPGTKTFWHDLLEWLPGLEDKCEGYTAYHILADKMEMQFEFLSNKPDYIIRNGTFFRPLNIPVPTISLIQDYYEGNSQQIDVCNSSTAVIFNSNYTASKYLGKFKGRYKVIPLGVDFDFFKPIIEYREDIELHKGANLDVLPDSILYVGSAVNHPKGFNHILDLINSTNYNFCLAMKDDFKLDHPRVKVFNKLNHEQMLMIYNSCSMILCPSVVETQHLSSIEAGACGLPIIITDVGAFHGLSSGEWGEKVINNNFIECIEKVKNTKYNTRQALINMELTKNHCKLSWQNLIFKELH
jgi:glycosyltransferase involved in cell wall biosynthesis